MIQSEIEYRKSIDVIYFLHDYVGIKINENEKLYLKSWLKPDSPIIESLLNIYSGPSESLSSFYNKNKYCVNKLITKKNSNLEPLVNISENEFFSYLIDKFVDDKVNINNSETNNMFVANNHISLNKILNSLRQSDVEQAFDIASNYFTEESEYNKAITFIAENSVFMKYTQNEIETIKNYGGKVSKSFIIEVAHINDLNILKTLEYYDVDWHFEVKGNNALHIAASLGNKDIMNFLLKKGLFQKANNEGDTPNDLYNKYLRKFNHEK